MLCLVPPPKLGAKASERAVHRLGKRSPESSLPSLGKVKVSGVEEAAPKTCFLPAKSPERTLRWSVGEQSQDPPHPLAFPRHPWASSKREKQGSSSLAASPCWKSAFGPAGAGKASGRGVRREQPKSPPQFLSQQGSRPPPASRSDTCPASDPAPGSALS